MTDVRFISELIDKLETAYNIDPARLPVASDISDRTLSLPLSPALTEEDQADVASALRECLPQVLPSATSRVQLPTSG